MSEVILEVKNIKKTYDTKTVLDIDYFSFLEGKIYALVGPNGSGKTTFLNILNLLEKPDEGQIFFWGQEINNKESNSNSDILKIRRRMTLVNQDPFLFHSTVYDNLAYGLKIRGIPPQVQQERIRGALNKVGLPGFENRKAYQLSGGEAQRVVIARALVLEPEILFLDEPTANVDQRHLEIVEKIIQKINEELKTTVILTTHDLSQAYRLAEEVISLLEGKIIREVPENIFRGELIEENGRKWFKVTEDLKLAVVTEKVGLAYLYIDPRDIILSYQHFQSSARNSFSGRIVKIAEQQNHLVRLEVEVGVRLITIITKESFQKMGLNLGSKVYLTFKASAVKIY